MKILPSYFFLILIFNLSSFDFSDDKLKVWNNTKDSIAFVIPPEPNYFPTTNSDNALSKSENDSLLKTKAKYNPKDESMGGVHFLAGNSHKNLMTFNTTWEAVIERTTKKKLDIYFFPASVMTSENYTWEEIWDKKLYTYKKEFSEVDLKKLNWDIYYKK